MVNFTFDDLLQKMKENGASDLYISVGTAPAIRVSGDIGRFRTDPLGPADTEALVQKAVGTTDHWDQLKQEGGINLAISRSQIGRFRVNAHYQRGTFGMVIRRINTNVETLEDLDLPVFPIRDLAEQKQGLILTIGATGSGKTTTLAAMVDHRNKSMVDHILTIEDPIEHIHDHSRSVVTQREIGMDVGGWMPALRDALRQAPDVIQVGEVQVREHMEYALTFADTGHLTMTTLHSTNTKQTLDRILNMFPEDRHGQIRQDLALNLKAIIGQRLVPRADGNGRVPAVEVFVNSPTAQDLLAAGKFGEVGRIIEEDQTHGMQTFDQAVIDLYRQGLITQDDAQAYSDSQNNVRVAIKNEDLAKKNLPGTEDENPAFDLEGEGAEEPTVRRYSQSPTGAN